MKKGKKNSFFISHPSSFINWEEQWKLHAGHFKDGMVRLKLGNDETLLMKPGPGFGDLSHPTTHLVLEMMAGYVEGKDVLDIGSGSGILSLAAALMGAKSVTGVEIEPDAILHAKENAKLNKLESIRFLLPQEYKLKKPFSGLILINMIMSEQEVAWNSLPHTMLSGLVIASGILKEHRKEYLGLTKQRGWNLQSERETQDWLGFIFQAGK